MEFHRQQNNNQRDCFFARRRRQRSRVIIFQEGDTGECRQSRELMSLNNQRKALRIVLKYRLRMKQPWRKKLASARRSGSHQRCGKMLPWNLNPIGLVYGFSRGICSTPELISKRPLFLIMKSQPTA